MMAIVRAILVAFALMAPAFAGAWFRVHIQQRNIELGYRLAELRSEQRDLTDELMRLELEFASMAAPDQLLRWAKDGGFAQALTGASP